MARQIGRLTSIGIAREATRGTGIASQYWVPVRELDFDDKVEYINNDSGFGRIEENTDSQIQQLYAEGSYGGKIFDRSVGVELCALFGAVPSSVQRGATGVYDHTWALTNTNQHSSMTVNIDEGNYDARYSLAMINSWQLEAVLDDYVRRTINLISKKSAAATNTPSYTDENEFIPKHIVFKLATNLAGLDGASAINIRSFNIEINKNAEALYVLGSQEPSDIVNKQVAISGSIEAYYDDITTFRNFVFANTRRAMRIDIVNTDVTIGGSHNPALRFDLANVRFGEFERGWDNNDVMTQTINFDAMFSIADSSMISGRLTNLVAAYA
jgi:hypothetical protein